MIIIYKSIKKSIPYHGFDNLIVFCLERDTNGGKMLNDYL